MFTTTTTGRFDRDARDRDGERAAGAAQEPPRRDGWVVLGIDEYRALRARAFPATPDPAPPPVDATLTRVDYDLRISGETVTGPGAAGDRRPEAGMGERAGAGRDARARRAHRRHARRR